MISHVVFIVVIILLCLVIVNRYKGISYILLSALFVRVLWIILDYTGILKFFDTSDATGFERTAWAISQNGLVAVISHFSFIGVEFFVSIISFLYLFIDRGFHVISLVSLPAALLFVGILWKVTLSYSDRKTARLVAYFASFYPMIVMYSSQLLREVWIYLFVVLTATLILEWRQLPTISRLFKAFFSLIILTFLHEGFAVSLIILLLYSLWFITKKKQNTLNAVFVLCLIMGVIFLFSLYGMGKLGDSLPEAISYENIKGVMENRMIGGASYNQSIEASSLSGLMLYLPERVALFLFSPYPWMIRALPDLIVFFDAVFYMLIISRIVYLSRAFSSSSLFVLPFIIFIPSIIAFSVGTGNFGTAMRHRAKFSALLIMLFSLLRFENRKVRMIRNSET